MQHKVELSTLLKIVITNRLIKENKQSDRQLVNRLANEAIEALKKPEVLNGGTNISKGVRPEVFA